MKTYNLKFENYTELNRFIENKKLVNHKNILLQIFTGRCDIEFIEELVEKLKNAIPHIKIIGTTTSGEILGSKVYYNSTILSFSVFENTKIETYSTKYNKDSYKMGKSLIKKFGDNTPKVIITFVCGLKTNGEEYLNSFNDYNSNLIVAGGLAGDNSQFKSTIVFTQDGIKDNGAVLAALYNDNLIVYTKASFGWKSIGKTMTITKSNKNRVYEIDDIKVVDIYKKYLGKKVAKLLPKTGIEFPLMIKRDSINIPRAVIAKKEDGSLFFGGNLKEGDKVTLGYGNVEAILKYSKKIIEDDKIQNCETIFIYSCMARLKLMKNSIVKEITSLAQLSEISGFFAYGEFYSNSKTNKNEMLNQAMTLLCLCENQNNKDKKIKKVELECKEENLTIRALTKLIEQTSKELEEKNAVLKKRIEKKIKENLKKDLILKEQSKLAQMGKMLSVIAHQWRQPLSAISSTLLSVQVKLDNKKFNFDDKQNREEFLKFLKEKHNDVFTYLESLSETIEDFRNFFKPNKSKNKVKITKPIDKALSILKASIDNMGIKVNISYNNNEKVYIYKNEIMHVILNILKNAKDNFREKNIKDPKIYIKTFKENKKNIIEICDNGGGIDEDILPYIFDLYFSTKDNKNGTGLGLYISKVIVQEHNNGKISAYNKDNGVCFRIELPSKNDEESYEKR